jgi:hypothetical protein
MYTSSSRYPGSSSSNSGVASGSGHGWGNESSSSRRDAMYSQLHSFIGAWCKSRQQAVKLTLVPWDPIHSIDRACSPLLPEPDMALNLEIADIILAKANTCVEAASSRSESSMLTGGVLSTQAA